MKPTSAEDDVVSKYKPCSNAIAAGHQKGKLREVLLDLREGHGSVCQAEGISEVNLEKAKILQVLVKESTDRMNYSLTAIPKHQHQAEMERGNLQFFERGKPQHILTPVYAVPHLPLWA